MWVSALVLVAGVIAFITVRLGSSDDAGTQASETQAQELPDGASFTPDRKSVV